MKRHFPATTALLLLLAPVVARAQAPGHLFFDNFQRTTGLGSNWQTWYGGFSTNGTYAISSSPPGNGNWASVIPSVGTNDYSVSADIIIPSGSLDSGVVARSSDTSNFDSTLYAAQLATDGTVNLYRRNSWNWTLLSSVGAGIATNTSYNLKLLVSGNTPVHLEVSVNGALKITFDDSSTSRIASGPPGIQNYNASVQYTNFSIDAVTTHVFYDAFARTTGLGSNWQVVYGGFSTDGTYAVSGAPPSQGNWAKVAQNLFTNDYSVSANIIVPAGSLDSGLVARSSDASNFDSTLYAAQIATDGHVNLYRRNTWNWTLLSSVAATIAANTSYALRLVVAGSSPVHLEVWLNGTRQIVTDDNSTNRITTGGAGMENYDTGVKYASFTVDAASAPPAPTGSDVVWVNQVNTTVIGTTIWKSSGAQPYIEDAGAASQQSVASGTDGTFQYTVDEVNNFRFVGFGHTSTWQGAANIDFSFRMQSGHADVYENNVYQTNILVAVNDILSIQVLGGVAKYYKNGALQYTSTKTPTYPLYVITSMIDANSSIAQAKITGGITVPPPPPTQARVYVSLTGTGSGTATSNVGGISCPGTCYAVLNTGTSITFTATPDANSSFLSWSGACSGSGSCSFTTVAGDQTVWVNFKLNSTPPPPSGACNGICTRGNFPPGSWRPYAATSAFNRVIPDNAPLLAGQDRMVSRILSDISGGGSVSGHDQPGNLLMLNDGTAGWPTYWATSSDYSDTLACGGDFGSNCTVAGMVTRAPGGATRQGGNDAESGSEDHHMTIIDQTNNTEFDLWHVGSVSLPFSNETLSTGWSGFTALYGDAHAACSSGGLCDGQGNDGLFGNLAGTIRFEELSDAISGQTYINHALGVVVECTNGQFIEPSKATGWAAHGLACANVTGSDKWYVNKTNTDAPPMGARLHLNLTGQGATADITQINGMSIPEWKKVLLRTLVKYGAIINDTGADGYFDWHTEAGVQYTSMGVATDPWLSWARNLAGSSATSCWNGDNDVVLDCIYNSNGDGYAPLWKSNADSVDWYNTIWKHLQIVDSCVSTGTC
jgi:hypothetical protein